MTHYQERNLEVELGDRHFLFCRVLAFWPSHGQDRSVTKTRSVGHPNQPYNPQACSLFALPPDEELEEGDAVLVPERPVDPLADLVGRAVFVLLAEVSP